MLILISSSFSLTFTQLTFQHIQLLWQIPYTLTSDRKRSVSVSVCISVSVSVSLHLSVLAEILIQNPTENRNLLTYHNHYSDPTKISVFWFRFKLQFRSITNTHTHDWEKYFFISFFSSSSLHYIITVFLSFFLFY